MIASEGAGVGSVNRCLVMVSTNQDGYPMSPCEQSIPNAYLKLWLRCCLVSVQNCSRCQMGNVKTSDW